MLGIFGIVLSLVLLMLLAYRGYNVLVLAPLMALLAVVLGQQGPLLATYTQIFMQSLGGYLIKYFPLFLLGSIFGKLMGDSGSARSISQFIVARLGQQQAILAVVLSCGILTYGGVSLFVVAFAVYPIAADVFRISGTPKRFIPAAIALGAFTFTMTALPGTPAIQNAIPMPFFGTTPFAAPVLGIIGGAIMLCGGTMWLNFRARRAIAAGESYREPAEELDDPQAGSQTPSFWVAILPILIVITGNFVFSKYLIPNWETPYLSEAKYGATELKSVLGIWSIICGLLLATATLIVLHWKRWTNLQVSINQGTKDSLLPIFNTASEVGYGTVIASLAGFIIVRDYVVNLSPGNPLVSEAIAVTTLAGITGSASGGLSIALETLGATYLQLGEQSGISPELLHRVASMSAGAFDTLPHNGAVITLLAITNLTHRTSYADIFMVAVLIPAIATITVIVVGSMFGSF
ncbi:fructuronate transporter [Roseimaritima multifibrata]|uniref:Fructuronate transporter n=1 Tax=Roseimaritima multifibrata TaxID=1930274 RepID=A0A517MMY2_9BACT|nr:GntP family permease [Roseimaritima multifibrata]QDS96232.1 fructuronate transporter [Roseimaritima multifibrata]